METGPKRGGDLSGFSDADAEIADQNAGILSTLESRTVKTPTFLISIAGENLGVSIQNGAEIDQNRPVSVNFVAAFDDFQSRFEPPDPVPCFWALCYESAPLAVSPTF